MWRAPARRLGAGSRAHSSTVPYDRPHVSLVAAFCPPYFQIGAGIGITGTT
jgi:hypothetical protein